MMTNEQKALSEILESVRLGNMTYEEANIQLEAIGSNIRLVKDKPKGDPIEGADEEGYIPQPAPPDVVRELDMKRYPERAGMTIEQKVNGHTFYTTYDENGYHIKSVRV